MTTQLDLFEVCYSASRPVIGTCREWWESMSTDRVIVIEGKSYQFRGGTDSVALVRLWADGRVTVTGSRVTHFCQRGAHVER